MTADEWERIKALFDSALKLPVEERLQWLQDACPTRPDLFEKVRQLVEKYEETSVADLQKGEEGHVFAPGDLVADRFLILRLIAHGGMGQVYEAVDNDLRGIRVALKTPRPGLLNEREAYLRFIREVWVAHQVTHSGICRVFDLVIHKIRSSDGSETKIPCLTMGLLEGESLAAYLSRNRPLTAERALPIVRQLSACIQAMHDRRIIHRDIKPSNIMLDPGDFDVPQVVLIDFGLAKTMDLKDDAWQSRTEQQQAGAPYFISPEVLRGEPAGTAADLYSLGLVIDDMVTTRPAYRYQSLEELFWRKLHERPEAASARSTGLPADWSKTIQWCLNRDPADRPRSATEMLASLEGSGKGSTLRRLRGVVRMVGPRQVKRTWQYNRRQWIAAACTGTAGIAVMSSYDRTLPDLSTSILVMPFENLSSRQDQYAALCLGTTAELTRRLSYVKGLTALEAPADWKVEEQEFAGIRFVLRGMLHDAEGVPQLDVRLTDNQNGKVVWGESFGKELTDPLKLETYLTNRSLEEIRAKVQGRDWGLERTKRHIWTALGIHEAGGPAPPQTDQGEAVVHYQRAGELWRKRTLPSALEAVKEYKEAIGIDPKYALAYAELADVHLILLNYGHSQPRELLAESLRYADKAVSLDPTLPECHVARACAKQNLWAWSDSDSSYRRAIQSHPRFAHAHDYYGGLLLQFGHFDAALKEVGRAMQLDPFNRPAQSHRGMYLWYSGRANEAVRQLEPILRRSTLLEAHVLLGQIYAYLAAQSREPEATTYFTRSTEHTAAARVQELSAVQGVETTPLKWSDLGYAQAYAARGDLSSAHNYLDRLEKGMSAGTIPGTILAWGYASMKQWKKTLELLEYGKDHQEREMLYVKVHPLFQPLNGNSGYTSILKDMGLA